jgi:hypothetical protein
VTGRLGQGFPSCPKDRPPSSAPVIQHPDIHDLPTHSTSTRNVACARRLHSPLRLQRRLPKTE